MEHLWKIVLLFALFLIIPRWLWGQKTKIKLARLKCREDRDEGVDLILLTDLIKYCREKLNINLAKEPVVVKTESAELYNFPYIYISVEENRILAEAEVENLREYLLAGGFLHISGDTNLLPFFCREMKRIFPEEECVKISSEHPVFHSEPDLLQESNVKEFHAWGIVKEDRLVAFFTSGKREQILQIGVNVISYVFQN